MRLKWMECLRLASVVALIAIVGCNSQAPSGGKPRELRSGKPSGKQAVDATAKKTTPAANDKDDDGPAIGEPSTDEPTSETASKPEGRKAQTATAPLTQPKRELRMPIVELPPALAAQCLVKVGDAMPEIELPNQSGESTSLTSLLGPKATVILFWSVQGAPVQKVMNRQALEDLGPDVLKPFEEHGARVLGIAVREPEAAVRTETEAAGATFPQLVDRDGSAIAKISTGQLPRVLVLDGQGKITWLDVQYTRSTRRDLMDAVQYLVHK